MRKIFFTATIGLMIFLASMSTENLRVGENINGIEQLDNPKPIREEILQPQPANWWETNFVTAVGHGAAKSSEVTARTKALAKRAAMMDAQRNLAEQVADIHVTAKKNLVRTQVDAVIQFFTVVSEDYDEFGNCTVVLSVPVFGVNSVAQVAFPSVDKKNFPSPTKNINAQGNYTGLIIDCGDLELNPVLAPEIRDKNQTIYAYRNLERQKVLERGVVGYVTKNSGNGLIPVSAAGKNVFAQVGSEIFVAEADSRVGKNPLVIKVSELSDDATCPVISGDDANKILAENKISHFLDEGNVIFKSNRIRGMRM